MIKNINIIAKNLNMNCRHKWDIKILHHKYDKSMVFIKGVRTQWMSHIHSKELHEFMVFIGIEERFITWRWLHK